MSRYGPLHVHRDRLIVGDPGRRHLLLTRDALCYRDGTTLVRSFPWDELEGVQLQLQTSRFRFPGAVSGVISAAVMALTLETPDFGPEDGSVRIRHGEDETRLPLSRHHLGGYWRQGVEATQRLLDRMVHDAASRELAERPSELLKAVARAARR